MYRILGSPDQKPSVLLCFPIRRFAIVHATQDTYTLQANKIGEGTYGSVAIGVHNSTWKLKEVA